MKNLKKEILKTLSSLARTLAVGSLCEASSIFTYQPEMNEELKSQLEEASN